MKQVKCLSALAFGALLFFAGCRKNDTAAPTKTYTPLNDGLYVSNEGNYSNEAATLTYYDSATQQATTDIFTNVNDSALGTGGNGIIVYGSKMYAVVNVSNLIAVIDKRTCRLIKQIKSAANWSPRSIVTYNGKILVSAYNSTVSVIDTSSLQITNTITVGSDPEGLTVSGNTLYVANSGGLNFPNYDSTVSIVDLVAMKEIQKLKVGINPQKLVTDSKGNVYVFVWGNYSGVPAKVYKINPNTQQVADSSAAIIAGDKMIIYNDVLYFDGLGAQPVVTLNTNNLHSNLTNFVTDGTTLQSPYGINIDASNGNVYVTDAMQDFSSPGKVYWFSNAGKVLDSLTAGIIPDNVVFLR